MHFLKAKLRSCSNCLSFPGKMSASLLWNWVQAVSCFSWNDMHALQTCWIGVVMASLLGLPFPVWILHPVSDCEVYQDSNNFDLTVPGVELPSHVYRLGGDIHCCVCKKELLQPQAGRNEKFRVLPLLR